MQRVSGLAVNSRKMLCSFQFTLSHCSLSAKPLSLLALSHIFGLRSLYELAKNQLYQNDQEKNTFGLCFGHVDNHLLLSEKCTIHV